MADPSYPLIDEADRRLLTRLVDFRDGSPVHAWSCGGSLCDIRRTFLAKQVGLWTNGQELWAMASQCREMPFDLGSPVFVYKDEWPPYGITSKLRFRFFLQSYPQLTACFGEPCADTYLTYSSNGKWSGGFSVTGGTLNIELRATGVLNVFGRTRWEVEFSGCHSATVEAFAMCVHPFKLGGQGLTIPLECCPASETVPDVGFEIAGFTNRVRLARLVDYQDGQEVYASTFCCSSSDCDIADCCGCDASPFQWSMTVSGVNNASATMCHCHNGTWVLTLIEQNTLTGVCTWASEPGACFPNAPSTGMWTLTCDPSSGLVTLGTQNTPNQGGAATYTMPLADWDCLGPNTLSLFFNSPHCSSWPLVITVNPV